MSIRDTRTHLSMLPRMVSGKEISENSECFPGKFLRLSMICVLPYPLFISGYSQYSTNNMEDMINDVGRVNYLQGYLSFISSAIRSHAQTHRILRVPYIFYHTYLWYKTTQQMINKLRLIGMLIGEERRCVVTSYGVSWTTSSGATVSP
jgi:hypothetical protein